MSPMSDQFASGAVNEGVRLWDLRQPTFLVCKYLCVLLLISYLFIHKSIYL
jgi:hypothetical protein